MKKFKKFYNEHRVFSILMAIAIVCLILMATVLIKCFYSGSDKGKYGDRLEGIESVAINDSKISDIETKIKADKIVKSVNITITGKIVYFDLTFPSETSLVEAQSVALKSLDNFSNEEKAFYDFHFTLKQESTDQSDGFLIEGAKNKNGSGLVWNNNNPVTSPAVDNNGTEG